ncbi:MAG: pilus assembly PilX N-terminal domain-containing protein [Candidatus Omnitrophota bacterium]|jgi:hypothetical protein
MVKNNKGVVLALALIVTLVLSVLSVSFFIQAINENKLARRSVDSMRAFWLAEAGIAQVIRTSMPSSVSGQLLNPDHIYDARVSRVGATDYYTVTSTGTVNLPSGEVVSRTVIATVEVEYPSAENFPRAIETTADRIIIKGAARINPSDPNDPNGPKVSSDFSFSQLFGMSKEEMRSGANHLYTSSNFDRDNINGITWVDVDSGTTLNTNGNSTGSGILIVNGNIKFTGTFQFHGIIYVIGEFTATGTFDQYGSVLVESTAELDDPELTGTTRINYDETSISNVLSGIVSGNSIVSWKE